MGSALIVGACAGDSDSTSGSSADAQADSDSAVTVDAPESDGDTASNGGAEPDPAPVGERFQTDGSSTPTAGGSGSPSECATDAPPLQSDLSVELEEVGSFDGGIVYAAVYPVPDDLGEPWSQWGEGVVLPDGRFVSGVGDHRGQDGRAWFYEYDPATRVLAQSTEVGPALGHESGDWGYGKLHSSMLLDECDRIVTSTYWGSRRDLEVGGSYSGDHVIRYDPATREIESLGVPVEGYGLPSMSISPDRSTIYVEAVDPASDPDAGVLVVMDAMSGDIIEIDDSADHRGFRDILVTADGDALYANYSNGLSGRSADGSAVAEEALFGEGWFRVASDANDSGTIAIATRNPDALYRRDADGSVQPLGELEEYVASLDLDPSGTHAYYIPGAHSGGYELGTPLIAADLASGDRDEIVRLNDLIEPVLGVGVAGSYNVVADPSGQRVFVGLNGSSDAPDELFGDVVLAVVEFD